MTFTSTKKQILALTTGTLLIIGAAVTNVSQAQAGSSFNAVFTNGEISAGIVNTGGNFHFGIGINPWGYINPGHGWNGNHGWNDHGWKPKRKRYVVTGGSGRGFVPLRARPGRGATKLAFIPHRSKRVFGKGKTVRRHGVSWTKVRFHGQVGWVKTRQIRRIH
jgi:hypothetical protein